MNAFPIPGQAIPCGHPIPASLHAVSVSLPTMEDVVGYEEKKPEVIGKIKSGYPRFVQHFLVARLQQLLKQEYRVDGEVVVLHCEQECRRLEEFVGRRLDTIPGLGFGAVILPNRSALVARALRFLQHSGYILSSRQARDELEKRGALDPELPEEPAGDPSGLSGDVQGVRLLLQGIYGVRGNRVKLFPSGMAAFYRTFLAVRELQPSDKSRWVTVGWLYLDTGEILAKLGGDSIFFPVNRVDDLSRYLHERGNEVAGIVTEVMTNPLLETPDLRRLSAIAHRHDIPFVVDISMPSSVCIDPLPYADVVIESLTKFASGHGDVAGGVAIVNPQTPWGERLGCVIEESAPYRRDVEVLHSHIAGYRQRMAHIERNAKSLHRFFAESPRVASLHYALAAPSGEAYSALAREGADGGGVLSVVFDTPLRSVYDRLKLPKGPSFGTEFTLCMPYVYLAHYDLVTSATGRKRLGEAGIDPELLRISVGVEPIEEIIAAFEAALG